MHPYPQRGQAYLVFHAPILDCIAYPLQIVTVFFCLMVGSFQLGAIGPIFTAISQARVCVSCRVVFLLHAVVRFFCARHHISHGFPQGAAYTLYSIVDLTPAMNVSEVPACVCLHVCAGVFCSVLKYICCVL